MVWNLDGNSVFEMAYAKANVMESLKDDEKGKVRVTEMVIKTEASME
jgi:hypothetical protein